VITRRNFLWLLSKGMALVPAYGWGRSAQGSAPRKKRDAAGQRAYGEDSYGSGHFGHWVEDAQGLPAFRYTCDQVHDPRAKTPVESVWRSATDHTHQVGNDRILAAASNYGYLQIRQDEGGPKFLNDYEPAARCYGGGLGYLADGESILSTYYPGNGTHFEREFGMGYLRKQVSNDRYAIDQILFAPFGDDPVMVSQVTIANLGNRPAELDWVEYWGCQMVQFSYRSYMEGYEFSGGRIGGGSQVNGEKVARLRREFAKRFGHGFESFAGGRGLLEKKQFAGRSAEEEQAWERLQEQMAADPRTFLGPPVVEPSQETRMDDLTPPATFLASLDGLPGVFSTNAYAFFGQGGVLHPEGIGFQQEELHARGPESALLLKKRIRLEAGESGTVFALYGYVPEEFSAESLLRKYEDHPGSHFARSCAQWKQEGITVRADGAPWIERETRWHNYYLRSGFTYDDYFQEHIVSQGQVYQYVMGFQGAPRDPLQHALPLIFGESGLARQVLRYTLKSQHADGALPYAIVGHGMPMPSFWLPSDLDLWLLWLASEYVLATRDRAFLDEELWTYPRKEGTRKQRVGELLGRTFMHLVESVGTGSHGLIRGQNDDWNDEIYWRGIPEALHEEVRRESESTMNAAMAAYIVDRYAEMLRFAGDEASAEKAARFAERQRQAVRAQWAGEWFKRVWLGPSLGWAGEDRMWLETQPWALVSKAATAEQAGILVGALDKWLRQPSPIGAKQVSRKVDWPGVMPGETENGGVWAALDGCLVWGLATVDGAMAWSEWRKNSRANHAEVYPDVWYGAWSGPDVFCSTDSPHAGQTGYDWGLVDAEAAARPSAYRGLSWTAWPVMCMHRHAWPLYSAAKLAGIEFNAAGVSLAPVIPEAKFSFESRLIGVKKTGEGYEGWYAPQAAGRWTIRFKAPDVRRWRTLRVNGVALPQPVPRADFEGWIEFAGESRRDAPLRWEIKGERA
jgi:hypothetical protein